MRRLPLLDAALIAILVPIWLVAVTLHVRQVATGRLAHIGFYVTNPGAPHDHPRVRMFWPGAETADSELAIGDTLLSVGGADLAGAGPLEFFALAHEEIAHAGHDHVVPVTYQRGSQRAQTSLPLVPARYPWRILPLTLAFVVTGTLVLIRRPGAAVARAFFVSAMLFSIHWTWFFGGNRLITYGWAVVYVIGTAAMLPMILHLAAMVPEEVSPRRLRMWPWLFVVGGPILLTASIGAPLPPELGLRGIYALNVAFTITLLAMLTKNYLRSGPAGRRQLKWAVYGLYVGLAPMFCANLVTLARPHLWWLHDIAATAEVLIPICIFIAIVRFNLYDIDRLITATVAYSVLSLTLLGAVLVVVPPLAEAASASLGLERRIGTSAFSVVIAVSLLSFYRSLNPRLERILFRERYALQTGVNDLLVDLVRCDTIDELLAFVGKRLTALFNPNNCIVYALAHDQYTSVFAEETSRHRRAPPTLAAGRNIVHAVDGSSGPVDVDELRRSRRSGPLEQDRAVFAELAPSVLVPVRVAERLVAIISLGPKRSGDVYAPGDVALLAAVADRLGRELARLEEAKRTASGPVLLPRKYEIASEIGRGGMGVVYKVRHTTLDAVVALKLLPEHLVRDADLVARFHREARVMAQLRHPNIVRVYDVGNDGGVHYFVMEYIEGRSLNAIVREHGSIPLPSAIEIASQIGSALSYAHERRPAVIHRDIKPSNILIEDGSDRAVLTDFGIAKVLGLEPTTRTRTGDVLGTFKYAAPEQLRGDPDVDGRADVYSLGMVIYELLCGRGYFAGVADDEVARTLLSETGETVLDLGPDVPSEIRPILARAIARDRNRRYPRVSDLIVDLRAVGSAFSVDTPAHAAGWSPRDAAVLPGDDASRVTRRANAGERRAPSTRK